MRTIYAVTLDHQITSYQGETVMPNLKYLFQHIEKRECERYLELKGWSVKATPEKKVEVKPKKKRNRKKKSGKDIQKVQKTKTSAL